MKRVLILGALVALTGCSTLTAGKAEYSVEPIELSNGSIVCCKVTVHNSKDYENLKAKIVKQSDGSITVELDEKGVNASTPAAVMAENNAKLLDVVGAVAGKL